MSVHMLDYVLRELHQALSLCLIILAFQQTRCFPASPRSFLTHQHRIEPSVLEEGQAAMMKTFLPAFHSMTMEEWTGRISSDRSSNSC